MEKKNESSLLNALFESAIDGILLINGQNILDCNKHALELFRYSREELKTCQLAKLFPKLPQTGQSEEQWTLYLDKTRKRRTIFFEWTFLRADTSTFPAEVSLSYYEQESETYYIAHIRDNSRHKNLEIELRTKTAQLQATLESLPFDFWMNDTDNRTIMQNSYSRSLWGDTFGKHMERVTNDEEIKAIWRDSNNRALQGEVVKGEITYHLESGTHHFHNIVAPIRDRNEVIGILGLNIDFTDYRETQDNLKAALKERETLLREIHHRVKNNLQVVVSMINLQKRNLSAGETAVLKDIENRISTMALIHEQLYNSENLAEIYMPDYLKDLTNSLITTFDLHRSGPKLVLSSDEISLNIDTAIPLGLIANELLTNSIKHAFPDGNWGTIKIHFIKERSRRCSLEVSDNGVGFPHSHQSLGEMGLGLILVEQLTKQLNGRLSYETKEGSSFHVEMNCRSEG